LEQAADSGRYGTVNITGGEPLDHPDALFHVLDVCSRLSLNATLVTSAAWATSADTAHDVVGRLARAGLSAIFISFDQFHQQRIPMPQVAAAMTAAHEFGLVLGLSTLQGYGLVPTSHLVDLLAPLLPDGLMSDVQLHSNTMIFSGRAAKLSLRKESGGLRTDLRCSGVGLVVHEDGRVQGCCGPDLPRESPLALGSLHDDDLATVHSAFKRSYLLAAVRLVGLRRLLTVAVEAGVTELAAWLELSDGEGCNACMALMANPAALEAVRTDEHVRRAAVERALFLERDPSLLLGHVTAQG
jgi:hypothetical protein